MSLMEKPREVEDLMDRVEDKLKEDPKARNSDKLLIVEIMQDEAEAKFEKDLTELKYGELTELASPSSITRARRKLQNDHGLYQADDEVKSTRQKYQNQMRAYDEEGVRKV